MISGSEIITAVNRLITKNIQNIKCYGLEVKEGYTTPAIFTQLIPMEISISSKCIYQNRYMLTFTYFPKTRKESEMLEIGEQLWLCFGFGFHVKDRFLSVTDFSYTYVGEKNELLQVTMNLSFFDKKESEETAPIVTEVMVSTGLEE